MKNEGDFFKYVGFKIYLYVKYFDNVKMIKFELEFLFNQDEDQVD